MTTETQQQQQPTPGTPEHDAAMAARFDQQSNTPAPKPDAPVRPDHIPEKFWDAKTGQVNTEALLKSYAELEKKNSKPAPKPTTPPAAPAEGEQQQQVTPQQVIDAAATEFETNGELSEETYAALEKAGYSREMVDDYIAGQTARAEQHEANIKAAVGGADEYAKMAEWASKALSPDEKAAFNDAVAGQHAAFAVKGLYARYQAENKNPTLLGGKGTSQGGDAFRSSAELVAAMKDPRYKTDPAYRADVEAKLSRSTAVF